MDKSYILSVIRDFADERLRFEGSNWHWARNYLQSQSYQRWAVQEIMKQIEISEDAPPIRVVEDFIHKMECFTYKKGESAIIFSIARDMAEDILDVLIAMK